MPVSSLVLLTLRLLDRHILQGIRLSALSVAASLVVWFGFLQIAANTGESFVAIIATAGGMLFAMCLCYAWFAVRWHRLLLLDEPQHPVTSSRPLDTFTRYGWRLFRLVFSAWFLGAVALSLIELAFVPGPAAMTVLSHVLWIGMAWVFLRLTPLLPGIALDNTFRLHEAWRLTAGIRLPVLGLAFALYGISTGIQYMIPPEGAFGSTLDAVFVVATFWVQVLFHTTALTAIYQTASMRR